jgi:hypothetical protein
MLPVPLEVISPLSIVALGLFSLIIRWIAEFQLKGAGSDFALISTSLQLSLIFTTLQKNDTSMMNTLQSDILFFMFLLILWAVSIKAVQRAIRIEEEEPNRLMFRGLINPYSLMAFLIGSISVSLEIFWRLQVV